jgi:hypothetical protein
MTFKSSIHLLAALALSHLAALGCGRNTGPLEPWPLPTDPIVFQDEFTGAVVFQAFGNSKLDALTTDNVEQYEGSGCLRVTVPNAGAGYAGGAFTTARARDLSGYNALTLWAKASRAVTLDVAGLGNDNTGRSKFEARRSAVPVTTTWSKIVIPIPDPSKLTAEGGLFFFAAAPQAGTGYVVWFDDVRFEKLDTVTNPRPAMTAQVLNSFVGATVPISGTKVTFDVAGGGTVVVDHMPGYFDYESSDSAVAVPGGGVIRIVGPGTAAVTAHLDTTLVAGAVSLNAGPFTPGLAPTPTRPAADVISLFSNAYANVPVDKWSADWDVANVADLSIFGDDMKLYTSLVYAGIEFTTHPIDASSMTHFHLDVYAPAGTTFKVKLVDFGANGTFGGTGENRDSERELTFNAASTPPFVNGSWVGLDIPLSDFMNGTTGLVSRTHLAQLVISGDTGTVYVDNVYFHK